ncbi:MAG: NAD(P)H-dependent oxidoreductase [Planctomycetes bacterium]|nr:NAD(P)H-dependent oxidoreductase [Planctomycetota bacterium]
MNKILYVKGSPMGELSSSIAVASSFVKAYREKHAIEVDTLDLFADSLPEFDRAAANGKYALLHGGAVQEEDAAAWRKVEQVIRRFKNADKYVFSVPMWNFGIPYRLKQLLDLVIQPGSTFSYEPGKGYSGLLTGKKAFVIYSRGGEYTADSGAAAYDMQKPYFELALGFMGISDVVSVVLEPTLAGGPQVSSEKLQIAIAKAGKLVDEF